VGRSGLRRAGPSFLPGWHLPHVTAGPLAWEPDGEVLTVADGRPTRTARAVAAARAVGTGGLHDPAAGGSLPPREAAAVEALGRLVGRSRVADLATRVVTGGLTAHAVLRMHAIDRAVVEAVRAGCEQVVVVGAGFDTRAWRLDALAGTRVLEVDHPATQQLKRRRRGASEPVADLRFVAADLTEEDLAAVLLAAGHDATRPTVWVWEAVAMYLPAAAVRATLAAIGSRSAPASHLVMTFVLPELLPVAGLGRSVGPVVRRLFAGIGEPLRTTMSDDEVRRALAEVGFDARRITGVRSWSVGTGIAPRPDLFAAERLVVAVARAEAGRGCGPDGRPARGG
jgi:methyltransferase (TIGR00027 family)